MGGGGMHAFTHSASQIPGLFLFLLPTRLGMREMQQNMGVCPPGRGKKFLSGTPTWIPLIFSEDKKARSFAEKDAMEEKSYNRLGKQDTEFPPTLVAKKTFLKATAPLPLFIF